jgi:hypothetical protein
MAALLKLKFEYKNGPYSLRDNRPLPERYGCERPVTDRFVAVVGVRRRSLVPECTHHLFAGVCDRCGSLGTASIKILQEPTRSTLMTAMKVGEVGETGFSTMGPLERWSKLDSRHPPPSLYPSPATAMFDCELAVAQVRRPVVKDWVDRCSCMSFTGYCTLNLCLATWARVSIGHGGRLPTSYMTTDDDGCDIEREDFQVTRERDAGIYPVTCPWSPEPANSCNWSSGSDVEGGN